MTATLLTLFETKNAETSARNLSQKNTAAIPVEGSEE
jgi:hypothetical protein